jgi:metal-responsive CopG/Arc/MetJ family transcriptional regulator
MGRPKKEEKDKKANVSLSINPDVLKDIDKYLEDNNLSRSKFVEELWEKYIKDKK